MNVRFTRNGELIENRKIQYGESISQHDYPVLLATEEYYGKWINPVSGPILQDTEIKAEDFRYVKALNSTLKKSQDSSRPMFLVEGHYTGTHVFTVEEIEKDVYILKIPQDGSESHCVRYDPDGKDVSKLKIFFIDENGNERKAETEQFGRCVKFTAQGGEVKLRIKHH